MSRAEEPRVFRHDELSPKTKRACSHVLFQRETEGVVRWGVEEQLGSQPLGFILRVDGPAVDVATSHGVSCSTLMRLRAGDTQSSDAKLLDAIVEHGNGEAGALPVLTLVLAFLNAI